MATRSSGGGILASSAGSARRFDVWQTVQEVVNLMRVPARTKGLTVQSSQSPDIPRSLGGDAHRLRQVLTNLSKNAIKFTEQGVITLEGSLESQNDHRTTVRFIINGHGNRNTQEQLARLFSPFVQADASTTRKYGGTGLGLTISKQLVEMMGGTIGVETMEGHGSSFWFTVAFETVSQDQPVDQFRCPDLALL